VFQQKVVERDEGLDRYFNNDDSVVAPTVVGLQGVKDLLRQGSPPYLPSSSSIFKMALCKKANERPR